MLPDRAHLLLAFKNERQSLTRQEIMNDAGVTARQEFQSLLDAKLLVPGEWSQHRPREYSLSPLGQDRRDMYKEIYRFRNG